MFVAGDWQGGIQLQTSWELEFGGSPAPSFIVTASGRVHPAEGGMWPRGVNRSWEMLWDALE
jgi:hypothetical protein